MKSRWIAAVVCMLYLSIGTVYSAVHHHEDESVSGERCAACAWHHENQVDLPQVSTTVRHPETLVFAEKAAHSFFRELSLKIHPSRGPPLLPL